MITLATYQANFARPAAGQWKGLDAVVNHTAVDVVVCQELVIDVHDNDMDFRAVQGRTPGHVGEATLVDRDLRVVSRGNPHLWTTEQLRRARAQGIQISDRRAPWADITVDLPRIPVLRVMDFHQATRKHAPGEPSPQDVLGAAAVRRLSRVLAAADRPWLVGGDWNSKDDDPFGLTARYGATWFKDPGRIDGWLVHPALVMHVTGFETVMFPWHEAHDNHPSTFLTLGGKR